MTKNGAAKSIMVFSLLGALNGGYLTYVFWKNTFGSGGSSFCDINSLFSCSSVVTSPYAQFFGAPVCSWAIAVYLIMVLLAYKALKKTAAKCSFGHGHYDECHLSSQRMGISFHALFAVHDMLDFYHNEPDFVCDGSQGCKVENYRFTLLLNIVKSSII
jgi:hypothetical protein